MSSVNECFLFSFPRLLFCLLVVSIISRVMSHTSLTYFPLTLPVSFSYPHSHTHTDEQKSFSYSLSLTHTHTHTFIRNHLLRRSFVPKQSIFLLFYPLFVLCSVLPLFVLCFGHTKTAFLYYVNKLLLLQL